MADVTASTRVIVEQAPCVAETVTVRRLPAPVGKGYLLREPHQWTAEDLRDYVVDQIVRVSGRAIPRNSVKEMSIFKRFLETYQEFSGSIAQYAFEGPDNGWWNNAPIGIERFCRGSDKWFADKICDKLIAAAQG